ncbi:uncharacterized protein B0P05DRAFT_581791 [Gilbertella persicaria]|uniref:uncharacterized protein n=1 Tax=Gilbertella persicaria TaxID=101096 RepID=UPI00221E6670|nr:uncharacterized protein B0P05DRAFT_581791 [Gilbertella persicaria]KAI8054189.1 hypothetical protein B0P05DRAFT_581791 [Gilbertella persicaria]
MESAVRNDLGDLEEDYAELIIPLLEEHPYIFDRGVDPEQGPYSFDKFLKISTLISSRAFEVDAYHENALVPFADIFNHRGENEHVHFETEFEVCDACGALEYCEHQFLQYMDDSDAEEGEEGEEEWEDEDVEDMSDAKEEDDDDDEEMDTELPDLEELEAAGVDFYEEEKEEDKKDTCDMVLDRDVKKGEEVFNTYGEHPNINLLSKYGFCYDDNKNDYISISEDTIVDCVLAVYAENLKEEKPKASEEELEKLAVEKTRPRWEFFLENEHILCPSEEGEEEQRDDYEDDGCQDGCCGPDDDHEHDHHHEDEEEEHEHDEGGGCCGDEDDKAGKSRPYFVNYEGLFEDKLMCLLHVMFVSEAKFAKFVEDMNNALDYFEELANSQGEKKTKAMIDTKRSIYQVCRALVEIRRMDYLENGEWKTIEQEVQEREKVADNKRKYYAFTCRISEKKIIEKAIQYYGDLVKEYTSATPTSSGNKKKPVSKKNKKMKL